LAGRRSASRKNVHNAGQRLQITLLRHGKPTVSKNGKLSAIEYTRYLQRYDVAGIDRAHQPPAAVWQRAEQSALILCSDLPRAIQSAQALSRGRKLQVEPVFREIKMPAINMNTVKFSEKTWGVVSRLVWFLGYSNGSESFREAKQRAAAAAERLIHLAKAQGSVMLVGHGFLNYFIGRALLANGWDGPVIPCWKFWGVGFYQL
jgi:broad specificity phosphatase PhoE